MTRTPDKPVIKQNRNWVIAKQHCREKYKHFTRNHYPTVYMYHAASFCQCVYMYMLSSLFSAVALALAGQLGPEVKLLKLCKQPDVYSQYTYTMCVTCSGLLLWQFQFHRSCSFSEQLVFSLQDPRNSQEKVFPYHAGPGCVTNTSVRRRRNTKERSDWVSRLAVL